MASLKSTLITEAMVLVSSFPNVDWEKMKGIAAQAANVDPKLANLINSFINKPEEILGELYEYLTSNVSAESTTTSSTSTDVSTNVPTKALSPEEAKMLAAAMASYKADPLAMMRAVNARDIPALREMAGLPPLEPTKKIETARDILVRVGTKLKKSELASFVSYAAPTIAVIKSLGESSPEDSVRSQIENNLMDAARRASKLDNYGLNWRVASNASFVDPSFADSADIASATNNVTAAPQNTPIPQLPSTTYSGGQLGPSQSGPALGQNVSNVQPSNIAGIPTNYVVLGAVALGAFFLLRK